MFTGIIEERGELTAREELPDAARLTICGPIVIADARDGDSIAVNGVCLTVVEPWPDGRFHADVMRETLDRSSLGSLTVGSAVNLERAMAADGRFGGHIVQGHVDGTGQIRSRTTGAHWEVVRISAPTALMRYIVEKGSISVDGVSLTVSHAGGVDEGFFEVSLIPTTLKSTTLGDAAVGAVVNLEVDVLAKYVERMLGGTRGPARGNRVVE